RRERELHVGNAHDDRIDDAAEVARDETEADADADRKQYREHAYRDRAAGAVEDGREDVAALVIRAEQEAAVAARGPCWREIRIHEVERAQIIRIVRRDHG